MNKKNIVLVIFYFCLLSNQLVNAFEVFNTKQDAFENKKTLFNKALKMKSDYKKESDVKFIETENSLSIYFKNELFAKFELVVDHGLEEGQLFYGLCLVTG